VRIRLYADAGRFQATVQDDGGGFDVSSLGRPADGKPALGLLGMKERASLLGGRLDIRSRPGEGTTVMLDIPLTGALVAKA